MNAKLLSKTSKLLVLLLGVGLLSFVASAPSALAHKGTNPPIFPIYGFKLEVPDMEKFGIPGEAVSYELFLTNAGNCIDSYTVGYKSLWDVKTSLTIGPLKPGDQAKSEFLVVIPFNIEFGESNQTLIQISSNGNPTFFEIVNFKTTAVNWP